MTQPDHILTFWFEESSPKQWFGKDDAFDAAIKERFFDVHVSATQGELSEWRSTPQGRLAEIIILDQFSRNLYRDKPEAFAYDGVALILAQEAIHQNQDKRLTTQQRWILYLPYMHSESRKIHEEAVVLFQDLGMKDVLDYEYRHKQIIDQFGRYPHRNAVLGRKSTEEEEAFLKKEGSAF